MLFLIFVWRTVEMRKGVSEERKFQFPFSPYRNDNNLLLTILL